MRLVKIYNKEQKRETETEIEREIKTEVEEEEEERERERDYAHSTVASVRNHPLHQNYFFHFRSDSNSLDHFVTKKT